jgi:hypothetical protein
VLTAAGIVFGYIGLAGLRVALSRSCSVTFDCGGLTIHQRYFKRPLTIAWTRVHSVWGAGHGWSEAPWGASDKTLRFQDRVVDLTRVVGPGRFNFLVVLVPEMDLRGEIRLGAYFHRASAIWGPLTAAREAAGLCALARTPDEVPQIVRAFGRRTAETIPPDVAAWLGRSALPVN